MADFSEWDEEFKPEDPFSGAKAEDLTDGDYEFKILAQKLKEIKNNKCLELKMEVVTPGQHQGTVINELVWLTSIDNAKRFGATLKSFGFDVANWTPANGRPFSKELPKSLRWLVGMQVKAKKVTNTVAPRFKNDAEHIYHNINFKGRSSVDDGLPRSIGPEQLNEPDPNEEDDPFAESA